MPSLRSQRRKFLLSDLHQANISLLRRLAWPHCALRYSCRVRQTRCAKPSTLPCINSHFWIRMLPHTHETEKEMMQKPRVLSVQVKTHVKLQRSRINLQYFKWNSPISEKYKSIRTALTAVLAWDLWECFSLYLSAFWRALLIACLLFAIYLTWGGSLMMNSIYVKSQEISFA